MLLEEMTVRLQDRGVIFTLGEEILGWDAPGTLLLQNLIHSGEGFLIGVEAVGAAIGSEPVNDLAEALRGRVPDLHVIGDAVEPKTVEQATLHGATLARVL
jgi:hypothetical protein